MSVARAFETDQFLSKILRTFSKWFFVFLISRARRWVNFSIWIVASKQPSPRHFLWYFLTVDLLQNTWNFIMRSIDSIVFQILYCTYLRAWVLVQHRSRLRALLIRANYINLGQSINWFKEFLLIKWQKLLSKTIDILVILIWTLFASKRNFDNFIRVTIHFC